MSTDSRLVQTERALRAALAKLIRARCKGDARTIEARMREACRARIDWLLARREGVFDAR